MSFINNLNLELNVTPQRPASINPTQTSNNIPHQYEVTEASEVLSSISPSFFPQDLDISKLSVNQDAQQV